MRTLFAVSLFLAGFITSSLQAAMLIDFSPVTTGASTAFSGLSNSVGQGQIIASRFTLTQDVLLTGGAIFSDNVFGPVGTPIRFLIFANPSAAAIIDITTTVDEVSTQYTTLPFINRKHATIAGTLLQAGTYWFAMPSANSSTFTAATGNFADGLLRQGSPSGVPTQLSHLGKPFMQLEGTVVPEPATGAFVALGLGCFFLRRKRPVNSTCYNLI